MNHVDVPAEVGEWAKTFSPEAPNPNLPPELNRMSETFEHGYAPGALGRIVELHGAYYHEHWNFGRLFEARVAADVGEVERYLERHLDFETRVFDLAMMEYLAVGGRVHDAGGVPSALFVYRGPDGRILLCQMFRARLEELPGGGDRRVNDGIEFQIYERDGKTVVAWQEGEVVCVLVSDIPREQVIQLAFAKAVKV